jgi:hypothetical protein
MYILQSLHVPVMVAGSHLCDEVGFDDVTRERKKKEKKKRKKKKK